MSPETVSPLPNHPVLSPKLVLRSAEQAIEFYRRVFGAELLMSLADRDGQIVHAEMDLGGCHLMLADEVERYGSQGPERLGGTPCQLHVYVEDVDATGKAAVDAGARLLIPVEDQFYGDRSGRFEDPFGHVWIVATHVEDVSLADLQRRWDEMR